MRKVLALSLAVAGLGGGIAFAGYHWSPTLPVEIQDEYAHVYLGAARNSPNGYEYGSCQSYASQYGALVSCFAYDGEGAAFCWSDQEPFRLALAAVDNDSRISFGWDKEGRCTMITVEQNSSYESKGP